MKKKLAKVEKMFPGQAVVISTYYPSDGDSVVDIYLGGDGDTNGQGDTFNAAYVDLLEHEISRLRVIIQNMKEK
jgi:hypothetical protein